jgi:hypothetical protein
MITDYELYNIHLAKQFSKPRKLETLGHLLSAKAITEDKYKETTNVVLEGADLDETLKTRDSEDRNHWIQHFASIAAADLITLGKVQPETMHSMSLLPGDDFKEVVKEATLRARRLNAQTLAAEKEIKNNSLPENMV